MLLMLSIIEMQSVGIYQSLFNIGAVLVYDITDRDSYDKVRTWVDELRLFLPKDTPIAIAGNKCDLASNR